MLRRLRVPISQARARLFLLTDLVRSAGDETVVVFDQRGGVEPVALVREARLAYLEARVNELEQRERQPFTLAGSLVSALDDDGLDEALRVIRKEWTPGAPAPLRMVPPRPRRRSRR
jgi:hypothetical protein